MRFVRIWIMLVSLLMVQVHALVPHHHEDSTAARHDHAHRHQESTNVGDLDANRGHDHLHAHADLGDASVPKGPRVDFRVDAVLVSPLVEFSTCIAFRSSNVWFSGEPLTTGPPRDISARGPPVPVAVRA